MRLPRTSQTPLSRLTLRRAERRSTPTIITRLIRRLRASRRSSRRRRAALCRRRRWRRCTPTNTRTARRICNPSDQRTCLTSLGISLRPDRNRIRSARRRHRRVRAARSNGDLRCDGEEREGRRAADAPAGIDSLVWIFVLEGAGGHSRGGLGGC